MNDRILEVGWRYGEWTEEQFKRLELVLGRQVKRDEKGKSLEWSEQTHELTIDEAVSVGHEFTVKTAKPYARIKPNDPSIFQPRPSDQAPVNQKCNVIVAGTSVMEINEVTVQRDYCTDALQSDLNQGWRILAICVQPDQRRPDYVLGRVNKEK